jgi:hypothetical protein
MILLYHAKVAKQIRKRGASTRTLQLNFYQFADVYVQCSIFLPFISDYLVAFLLQFVISLACYLSHDKKPVTVGLQV